MCNPARLPQDSGSAYVDRCVVRIGTPPCHSAQCGSMMFRPHLRRHARWWQRETIPDERYVAITVDGRERHTVVGALAHTVLLINQSTNLTSTSTDEFDEPERLPVVLTEATPADLAARAAPPARRVLCHSWPALTHTCSPVPPEAAR